MERREAERLKRAITKRYKAFSDVVERSPFEPLYDHAKVVQRCVDALATMLHSFIQQEFDELDKQWERVQNLEYEADLIKIAIREHMPTTLYLPIPTSNIYEFLREMDSVADCAENVADLLTLRRTVIPQEVRKDFVKHVDTVIRTVNTLMVSIERVSTLYKTGFDEKKKAELLKQLFRVSEMEWKADTIKRQTRKKIYELEHEVALLALHHLLDILHETDEIADHAENVEARLRTILAR